MCILVLHNFYYPSYNWRILESDFILEPHEMVSFSLRLVYFIFVIVGKTESLTELRQNW